MTEIKNRVASSKAAGEELSEDEILNDLHPDLETAISSSFAFIVSIMGSVYWSSVCQTIRGESSTEDRVRELVKISYPADNNYELVVERVYKQVTEVSTTVDKKELDKSDTGLAFMSMYRSIRRIVQEEIAMSKLTAN